MSDEYELEFEIYVEKSRFALEKLVKNFKAERTMKSPQRNRPSPAKETQPLIRKQEEIQRPSKVMASKGRLSQKTNAPPPPPPEAPV